MCSPCFVGGSGYCAGRAQIEGTQAEEQATVIVLGGGVADAGDFYLVTIRHTVYSRSLPLATRELRIVRSALGHLAGPHGAAAVVTDELFARQCLARWIDGGSPAGRPELAREAGCASATSDPDSLPC